MTAGLPALKPKEVIKTLEKLGWYRKRQTGSHVIMVNEKLHRILPVPSHNKDLKKGTLNGIIKRTGLSKEKFLELREKR